MSKFHRSLLIWFACVLTVTALLVVWTPPLTLALAICIVTTTVPGLILLRRAIQAAESEQIAHRNTHFFYQAFLDKIPHPICLLNAQHTSRLSNLSFKQSCFYKIDHQKNESSTADELAEDLRILNGENLLKEQKIQNADSGSTQDWLVSKQAITEPSGQISIVCSHINITPWREAEHKASQIAQEKTAAVANMQEEICTPLDAVISMLCIALRRKASEAETRNTLISCLSNARFVQALVHDILSFSKIRPDNISLDEIDFDLRSLLSDALHVFHRQAESRSLFFKLEFDGRLPSSLRGDPIVLRQILTNLVSNALIFTEQGEVKVTVEPYESSTEICTVRFTIQDTSGGLPPRVIQQLNAASGHKDPAATRDLGASTRTLLISRQLVEAMGGSLLIDSSPRTGSTFVITLPLQTGGGQRKFAPEPPVRHSRTLHVLFAEDSQLHQLIIQNQLEEMGHKVDIVTNGQQAINALCQTDYDLVFMDGRMPNMDGYEATRTIRTGGGEEARVRNAKIHIVGLSSNARIDNQQRFLDAGMDEFLAKPVDATALHSLLSKHIAKNPQAPQAPRVSGSYTPKTKQGDFLARLRTMFDAELPERIIKIEQAIASQDFATLARQFHSIRGGAHYTGDDSLVLLSSELEVCADKQDTEKFSQLWPEFKSEVEKILASRIQKSKDA